MNKDFEEVTYGKSNIYLTEGYYTKEEIQSFIEYLEKLERINKESMKKGEL